MLCYLDSAFCAKDKKRRTRVCLPGAGIEKISAQLDMCLKVDRTKPIVFLSTGGNDICKVRSEELQGDLRRLWLSLEIRVQHLWYAVCCQGGD
ncbi:hypothetical protein E2C01_080760 [Portunus trituberculatus]|uniref:SGNH hydrolase-type esterase domain-containing protein n=1 Tax=Portunus trituberculatus TaxID=210409 RepID=A0A5B7J0G3_PORTR|nr:hypothetical protein [Portunus trituberculatus]